MSKTELAVSQFLRALRAPSYDIGIGGERGGMLPGHDGLTSEEVLKRLPFLRYRNSRGEHIFVRPAGEHACTLLDDLDAEAVRLLHREGFAPAVVVETSPNNFQAWLRHTDVLPRALSSAAARVLAARFGGDPGAADWRHFGRMPGFTNPKPKHRRANGQAPFVLLRSHGGTVFPEAKRFRSEVEAEFAGVTAQRGQATHACCRPLSPPRGRRFSHLSVTRFRDLPKFAGSPAQADLAFCVAAVSGGMPENEVAEAIEINYLSRNPDPRLRAAYVGRTIATAGRHLGS